MGGGDWALTLPKDILESFLPLMKVVCLIKWNDIYFLGFILRTSVLGGEKESLFPLLVLKDSQQQQQ